MDKPGKKNLIPLNKRTKEEQREICQKGAKKSTEVRRKKKDLKERFKIGLEFLASEKAKALKKSGQLEKAELVKEVGLEVYSLLEIANNTLIDEKVQASAWNDIMDRTEGKPVQKNILDATVNETQELTDKEKELIDRQIAKQANKLKND